MSKRFKLAHTSNPSHFDSFILRDAYFGPIQHTTPLMFPAIQLFLDYLLKHENKDWLMVRFSHIYVLIAKSMSDGLVRKDELKWSTLLPLDKADFLTQHGFLVLGFIALDRKVQDVNHDNVHFIYYIDTFVPKLHIAKYMMLRYQTLHSVKYLLPQEILDSAKDYWRKWFRDIIGKTQLDDLLDWYNDARLPNKYINWDVLE